MVFVQHVPPGFRDFEWVSFAGRVVRRTPEEVVLSPVTTFSEEWSLSPEDVQILEGSVQIFLRRGGLVKWIIDALTTNRGQETTTEHPEARMRMHSDCPHPPGTMCTNNIELCCDGPPHRIMGQCHGRWDCS
jgi:hypothetical protein